jgi:hypothetical protein
LKKNINELTKRNLQNRRNQIDPLKKKILFFFALGKIHNTPSNFKATKMNFFLNSKKKNKNVYTNNKKEKKRKEKSFL